MKKQEGKNMRKTLELCKVRNGEAFTLDGVDFVKLADDQGAVFALTRDVVLKSVPFEKEGADRESHNNYCGSKLDNAVYRWITDGHNAIYAVSVIRDIDLTTMDGMTDYGCPTTIARVLTIDEYRKYRRFIPLTDTPYWLATGYSTKSDAENAYLVYPDGSPYYSYVYDENFAARPTFYLNPSVLVSAEDGEELPVLKGFTNKELIEELFHRVVASECRTTSVPEGREEHGR